MVRCFCSGHCPGQAGNGTCVTKAGGFCYAFVQEVVVPETNRLEAEYSFGCLPPDESGYMQCQGDLSPHAIPRSIKCCRDRDHCNVDLKPQYKSSVVEVDPSLSAIFTDQPLLWILPVAIAVVLLIVLLIVILKVRSARRAKSSCEQSIANSDDGSDSYDGRYGSPDSGIGTDVTNSSGARMPLLVGRTVSRDLGRNKPLARGRYGQVSVVVLRGVQVAMKEFSTTEEVSWKREVAIYNTPLLRHENILGFIAADIRGSQGVTKMLLLTDFHEKGSLFDFLSTNVPDEFTSLQLMITIANGLVHLHKEIVGKQSKPAIAHRDLKSKNILVKNDLTCCIADFGLSVTYESSMKTVDCGEVQAENIRVGTKRYMAPEILDGTLAIDDFESYKRADVYAFSLVLWEIMRRTSDGMFANSFNALLTGLLFSQAKGVTTTRSLTTGWCPATPHSKRCENLCATWKSDLLSN